MATLVVRRLHSRSADPARSYRVMVDGQQRALIGDDSTVQVNVMPGEHRLQLQIGWRRSREAVFSIEHGEIVRMECRARSNPLLALLYITIWRNDYIALETVKTWTS